MSVNPFGAESAPPPVNPELEEDEAAKADRKPLIIGGAVAATAAVLAGAWFLVPGMPGHSSDDTSAAPVPARTAKPAASATASPTASATASASPTVVPQFARNPFFALVTEGNGTTTTDTTTNTTTNNTTNTPTTTTPKGTSETQPTPTVTVTAPAQVALTLSYAGRLPSSDGKYYDVIVVNGAYLKAYAGKKVTGTPFTVKSINSTHTSMVVTYKGQPATLTKNGKVLVITVPASEIG